RSSLCEDGRKPVLRGYPALSLQRTEGQGRGTRLIAEDLNMSAASTKSKSLGLSIVIGIAIGTLAAILSTHFAVSLIAGIFVCIAAGGSFGCKSCPQCGGPGGRASR